MRPPRLELDGVDRRWGARVGVADLRLAIEPGERVALVGPSGSGKTTVLRLLMGALRPSAGRVRVDDTPTDAMAPAALRAHRRRCGLIDQGSLLIPQLTVHGNVVAGLLPDWPWWRTALSLMVSLETARVRRLLADVGLAERQWDSADTLSGGQQQRVAIARALAAEPTVILADEPTAALDPATAAEINALLVQIANSREATLIVSTHRVSQIDHAVDRVVGLRDGGLVFDCPPDEITDARLDALYEGSRERE